MPEENTKSLSSRFLKAQLEMGGCFDKGCHVAHNWPSCPKLALNVRKELMVTVSLFFVLYAAMLFIMAWLPNNHLATRHCLANLLHLTGFGQGAPVDCILCIPPIQKTVLSVFQQFRSYYLGHGSAAACYSSWLPLTFYVTLHAT